MERWDDSLWLNDKRQQRDAAAARRVEARYRARHRRGPPVFLIFLLRLCGLMTIATGIYMVAFPQEWILKYTGGLILLLGAAITMAVPALVFRIWVGMQIREKISS